MKEDHFLSDLPSHVRVSLGSAIVLGLLEGKLDSPPTTVYLMTFRRGRCTANCGFCPQARRSHARGDMLSRVSWPAYPTLQVIDHVENAYKTNCMKRVCIQALNYPEVFSDLFALSKGIFNRTEMPISVSCQPLNRGNIARLAEAGVQRIGIPLDAATEKIFDAIKGSSAGGPYGWETQFELLRQAVEVFGRGKVSTHLIVGLGETEKEMVALIHRCADSGILPALFAFTPIRGTALENRTQPQIQKYRRIQVARYLIVHGISRIENMRFGRKEAIVDFGIEKDQLDRIVKTGDPFRTSGCPDCNRPYYNEKPRGPIFNFPHLLRRKELLGVTEEMELALRMKPENGQS